MRFVLDENLPRQLVRRLDRLSRFPVEHALDYRDAGTPDEDLKALAAEQRVVIVTRDWEFIPSDVTRRTYLDKQVSALILAGALGGGGLGGATLTELETWFREHWARVEDAFERAGRPIVIRAYLDGRLVIQEE